MAKGFLSRAASAVAGAVSSNLGDLIEEERKMRLAKYDSELRKDTATHTSKLNREENDQRFTQGLTLSDHQMGNAVKQAGQIADADKERQKDRYTRQDITDADGNVVDTGIRDNWNGDWRQAAPTVAERKQTREAEQTFQEKMVNTKINADQMMNYFKMGQDGEQFSAAQQTTKSLAIYKMLDDETENAEARLANFKKDSTEYADTVKRLNTIQENKRTIVNSMGGREGADGESFLSEFQAYLKGKKAQPGTEAPATTASSTVPEQAPPQTAPAAPAATTVPEQAPTGSGGLMSKAAQQASEGFSDEDAKRSAYLQKLVAQQRERLAAPDMKHPRRYQESLDESLAELSGIYEKYGLNVGKNFYNQ